MTLYTGTTPNGHMASITLEEIKAFNPSVDYGYVFRLLLLALCSVSLRVRSVFKIDISTNIQKVCPNDDPSIDDAS